MTYALQGSSQKVRDHPIFRMVAPTSMSGGAGNWLEPPKGPDYRGRGARLTAAAACSPVPSRLRVSLHIDDGCKGLEDAYVWVPSSWPSG